jgi:hypothetical protein
MEKGGHEKNVQIENGTSPLRRGQLLGPGQEIRNDSGKSSDVFK